MNINDAAMIVYGFIPDNPRRVAGPGELMSDREQDYEADEFVWTAEDEMKAALDDQLWHTSQVKLHREEADEHERLAAEAKARFDKANSQRSIR